MWNDDGWWWRVTNKEYNECNKRAVKTRCTTQRTIFITNWQWWNGNGTAWVSQNGGHCALSRGGSIDRRRGYGFYNRVAHWCCCWTLHCLHFILENVFYWSFRSRRLGRLLPMKICFLFEILKNLGNFTRILSIFKSGYQAKTKT